MDNRRYRKHCLIREFMRLSDFSSLFSLNCRSCFQDLDSPENSLISVFSHQDIHLTCRVSLRPISRHGKRDTKAYDPIKRHGALYRCVFLAIKWRENSTWQDVNTSDHQRLSKNSTLDNQKQNRYDIQSFLML